jgi:hypothetical protein
MSLVHLMFLNYSSDLWHPSGYFPKFSLPYSLAFMELISRFSNGTMGMLRLPSLFSFPSISLGTDTTSGISLFLALLQVDILT